MMKTIGSCFLHMEQVKGVEPSSQPWESRVLPINYTCASRIRYYIFITRILQILL